MEFKRLEELYVYIDIISLGDLFATGEGHDNETYIEVGIRMSLVAWAKKKTSSVEEPAGHNGEGGTVISVLKRQGVDVRSIL